MYKVRSTCRMCDSASLTTVLDLGEQCLHGQFPAPGEADPPRVPVRVQQCQNCGLVQSPVDIDPEAQFREYYYRSSVSQTMRDHLNELAMQAYCMFMDLNKRPQRILDIAGNDGWLLSCFPKWSQTDDHERVLVDPSNVECIHPGIRHIRGFFPDALPETDEYDLVVTAACLYSVHDPMAFARAVRRILRPNGLWVVEVADLGQVLKKVAVDYFVSEHVSLFGLNTLSNLVFANGMKVVRAERNDCNGGSIRAYIARDDYRWLSSQQSRLRVHDIVAEDTVLTWDKQAFQTWADRATRAIDGLRNRVQEYRQAGKKVHILAASTKSNLLWQAAVLTPDLVEAASDRDPRKVGRRLPGTGIPILSEMESRAARPDVYISTLPFQQELLCRERDYLESGGKIVFCLPHTHEFGAATPRPHALAPANPSGETDQRIVE